MTTRNFHSEAVGFDGIDRAQTAAAAAAGRGGQGGEPNSPRPIAEIGNKKIRFDGDFFWLPNTHEGQQLYQLITGEKPPRQTEAWFTLHARTFDAPINALISVLSAMSNAARPAHHEHYQATLDKLVAVGIRGKTASELAADPWTTAEKIDAWIDELRRNNRPNNILAVLTNNLRYRINPPAMMTTDPLPVEIRREATVRVKADDRQGEVNSILQDGTICVLMAPSYGEMDFFRADQLEVIS